MPCPYKRGVGLGRGMARRALSQSFNLSQLFLKLVSGVTQKVLIESMESESRNHKKYGMMGSSLVIHSSSF